MTSFERQVACPNCGADIRFKLVGERARVCDFCHSVIARTDAGLSVSGKMADLLEIPTPFALDRTGMWRGVNFVVLGRLQMDRVEQASAPWQEILVAFPQTDAMSWIAYAQGRWYVSSEVTTPAGALPPVTQLRPGAPVALGPHGTWTVQEIGRRKVVSGEGAITHAPNPGAVTSYADISAPDGRFGTIDYASTPPTLYLGSTFDPGEVRFDDGMPLEAPSGTVSEVTCPNCGASLPIQSQATERIVCQYCFVASDLTGGALAALGPAPRPPFTPHIALGTQGSINGQRYIVTGVLARSCVVEGTRYPWHEYLLFGGEQVGYRWLTVEEGTWSFISPIEVGEVATAGSSITYRGVEHRFKQAVTATVDYVVGEFYWKVGVGDQVDAVEWEGPTGKVSRETTPTEVTYSLGVRPQRADLLSFGIGGGAAKRKSSSGMLRGCLIYGGGLSLLLFATCVVLVATSTPQNFESVLEGDIEMNGADKGVVKKILAEAKIEPSSVRVHVDKGACEACKGIALNDGRVTRVSLEAEGIEHVAAFGELDKLVSLLLTKNRVQEVEGLCELDSLTELDLSSNEIRALGDMSDCDALEKLNLAHNKIDSLAGLEDMAALRELSLIGNPIGSVKGMGDLPALTTLELADVHFTSFAGLGPLPKLQTLSVKTGDITSLDGLSGLAALTTLHLSHNKLTSLAGVGSIPQLQTLDVSHNQLSSLAGLAAAPKLETLTATNNQLTTLAGDEGSATVTTLDVSENRLTTIDGVAPFPKLSKLLVSKNTIAQLGSITSIASLSELRADNNALTDLNGVSSLSQLQSLYVSHNKIESLDPLVGMSSLTTVDASHNNIRDARAFVAKPPANYTLVGNIALVGVVLYGGSFVPAPVVQPASSPNNGSRSPSSRYRSSGGTGLGK